MEFSLPELFQTMTTLRKTRLTWTEIRQEVNKKSTVGNVIQNGVQRYVVLLLASMNNHAIATHTTGDCSRDSAYCFRREGKRKRDT